MSEGALVYMIPSPEAGSPVTLAELAAPLDGLVLQGGTDLSPESYGETPLDPAWKGDRVRDLYEIALVKAFREQGKPVLGICRGAQLLNVAFGGTLYQDIKTQRPESVTHRDWEIYEDCQHGLRFEPGSKLAEIYAGQSEGRINSIHHQAIKDLGPGLQVEAKSEDGLVEAIAALEGPYLRAVQWHPEFQRPAERELLDGRLILRDFLKHCEAGREL
jgi:putative glutamine amidotransferase